MSVFYELISTAHVWCVNLSTDDFVFALRESSVLCSLFMCVLYFYASLVGVFAAFPFRLSVRIACETFMRTITFGYNDFLVGTQHLQDYPGVRRAYFLACYVARIRAGLQIWFYLIWRIAGPANAPVFPFVCVQYFLLFISVHFERLISPDGPWARQLTFPLINVALQMMFRGFLALVGFALASVFGGS